MSNSLCLSNNIIQVTELASEFFKTQMSLPLLTFLRYDSVVNSNLLVVVVVVPLEGMGLLFSPSLGRTSLCLF